MSRIVLASMRPQRFAADNVLRESHSSAGRFASMRPQRFAADNGPRKKSKNSTELPAGLRDLSGFNHSSATTGLGDAR